MRKDRCGWSCKVISFMAFLSWRRSEIAKQSKGKVMELVSLLVSQRNLTSWNMPDRSRSLHNCLSPFSCFNKTKGWLTNHRNLLLTVAEAGKFKIKELADSVSNKDLFSGSQMYFLPVFLHVGRGNHTLWSFMRAPSSCPNISQRSYLPILPHLVLGFNI